MIELIKLDYDHNALEPQLDAQTVEIHHNKHHQAYVDNYNKAISKYPDLQNKTVEEVLTNINSLDINNDNDKQAIINHGGGIANHNLYWEIMNPSKQPDLQLIDEIEQVFGSIDSFKLQFTETALKHFGSGWTWLTRDQENKLHIHSLPNQDSPLSRGQTPIITLDLWEHAFYLKYRNKKADYIKNWWSLIKLIQK